MAKSFYIKIGGKPFGPFDDQQVQEMITSGNIVRESEISENRIHWDTVGDYDCFQFDTGEIVVPQSHGASIGQNDGPNDTQHVKQNETSAEHIGEGFPSGQSQWYYSLNGRTGIGPYPESTIATLIRAGQISPQALVWQKNGSPDVVAHVEAFAQCLPQSKSRRRPKETAKFRNKKEPQEADNSSQVADDLAQTLADSTIWVFVLVLAVTMTAAMLLLSYVGVTIILLGLWASNDTARPGTTGLILWAAWLVPVAAFFYFTIVFNNFYICLNKFERVRTEYRLHVTLNALKKTWWAGVFLLSAFLACGIFAIGLSRLNNQPERPSGPRTQIEESINE